MNYGGLTVVGHNNCLGTGAATFLGNAHPSGILFPALSVTLPNDLLIGQATGDSWSGPINANGKTLTFAGTVHYAMSAVSAGKPCIRFSSGLTVHKGNVVIDHTSGTGFVCDGSVTFEKAITPKTPGLDIGCQINGGTPTVTFKASGNALQNLIWANNPGTYVFAAPNIFATPRAIVPGSGSAGSGNFFVDLGGCDQLVESVYDGKPLGAAAVRQIYSATPARITMQATASRTFRGSFNDKVTLCWAPTGNYTYTITNVTSTTSEGLVVSNGTVSVKDGATFPNVTALEVWAGAKLVIDSGSSCGTTLRRMVIGSTTGTTLSVADGAAFTVDDLYTVDASGNLTKMAGNTTYTSANIPALGANVTVTTKAGTDTYVGASGGLWNTPSNWASGSVPGAGSLIRVSNGVSSIVVDIEASIESFTGPSDTALTLSGSGKLVLAAVQTVIENAKDLIVQCEISGSGKLVSRGAGALKLEHANTYTGGTLRDTDAYNPDHSAFSGAIYVGNNAALGTGAVAFNCHAGLSIDASVTEIANDITWDSTYTAPLFYSHLTVNGTTAFTGTLDFSKTRCARVSEYGSSVTYNNVVLETTTSFGWDHILIAKSNTHNFTGRVSGTGSIGSDSYSNWRFSSVSNDLYSVYFYSKTAGNVLESLVRDTFLDTTRVIFRTGSGATAQSWKLHGFDQTVDCACDSVDGAPAAHVHYVETDADKPARLTMKATGDRSFAGYYKGPLSVCWNPTGAYTLTLTGGTHSTSGALIVSNGTVSVTGGASFANLSGIEVAKNATLSFASGTTVRRRLAKLVLQEGATFAFADATELLVEELWTADAAGNLTQHAPDRTYTSTEIPALNNVRVTTVHVEQPSVPVIWTAGGGADTSFATDANWSAKPDFTSAGTVATFANAGSVATATTDVTLKGIAFGTVEPFTVGGAGTISLYEAGIAAQAPGAGTAIYTVSAPLALRTSSAWSAGTNTTLSLEGAMTGCETMPGASTITVTGDGTVNWRGDPGGTCAADFVFSNTTVNVYGQGLGASTAGRMTFTDYPQGHSHVTFSNAVVNQEVYLRPQPMEGVRYGSGNFINFQAGTTNVFNGLVSIYDNYLRFACPDGACCIFAGGVYNDSYFFPVPLGAGLYVITNTPVNVDSWWSDTTGHTLIAVPGNQFRSSIHLGNASAVGVTSSVRLDVDNAASLCPELYLSSQAKFDLNGHDFGVNSLATGHADATPEVTSATPATLYATNFTTAITHPVRFTGAASFVKGGSGNLFLSGVSTSTGTVEVVTGGTLLFSEAGSWRKASRATVQAGAKLVLGGDNTFGKSTDVYIENSPVPALDIQKEGAQQPVRDLYIGGVKQARGTWGATGSKDAGGRPPQHVDDSHFAGAGVLTVVGNQGLMVIVR